jgi:hypothetical protein
MQVPAGRHKVTIEFARTPDRTLGGVISIFFFFGVGGWWIVDDRRRRSEGAASNVGAG